MHDNKDYMTANLEEKQLAKLQSLEEDLRGATNKEVILIAYVPGENEAKLAAGIDDDEELNRNASSEEVKRGNYTEVTTLSYDEVNPS